MYLCKRIIPVLLTVSVALQAFDSVPDLNIPMGIHTPVVSISKTAIQDHKVQIAQTLQQKELLRKVVSGGVGVGIGLGLLVACYSMYNNYRFVDVQELNDQNIHHLAFIATVVERLKEKIPGIQDLPNMEAHVAQARELFEARARKGWGEWFLGLGAFIVQGLALNRMQQLVADELFHELSVDWFTTQKTAIESVYKELSALNLDINGLKSGSVYITRYQADRYANSLIRLSNAFMHELEAIIGYINAQAERLHMAAGNAQGDHLLGTYLEQRASAVAQTMHEFSQHYEHHTTNDERVMTIGAMFDCIRQFSLEVNSSLNSFKRFELQKQAAH